MTIDYQIDAELSAADFADILHRSTLDQRRPVDDPARLKQMLQQADLIVTARTHDRTIVGVSRAISDFSYCTYLSDLAVDVDYQRRGIGRELIRRTHQFAGLQTHLILLSAPAAEKYYPRIGMQRHDSCWIFPGTTELD